MVQTCNTTESSRYPMKHPCPENGIGYSAVSRQTLLHHIRHPWRRDLPEQGYYFCTDPNCHVVYFGQHKTIISAPNMRTPVWQKQPQIPENDICYCFGVSLKQTREDHRIRDFIVRKTAASLCSCKTLNPSGKCCLADFPKP